MRDKIVFFLCILLAGCGLKKVSPQEYIAYFDDESNGLITQQQVGVLCVKTQYRTEEYETIKSLKNATNSPITQEDLSHKDSVQFVVVRFETSGADNDVLKIGLQSQPEYDQRIQYLSMAIMNDFKLIDGQDTLGCVTHQWERNFNIANFTNIVLVFKNNYTHKAKTLLYDDQIFGLGKVSLHFKERHIESIPQISF
jgi:hypothetical protein